MRERQASYLWLGLVGGVLLMSGHAAFGQQAPGAKNPLSGFSQNKGQPIQITSQSLEVRDKDKMATFIGKVRAVQGETVLESAKLIVFYDGDQTGTDASARSGSGGPLAGGGQIKRLEAKGGVIMTQKDQVAVGEEGIYEMKANTVTLIGNVTVTQGKNVIQGHKVVVNLETGLYRVEPKEGGGTVSTVITPNETPANKPAPSAAAPKKPPANGVNARPAANGGNSGSTSRPATTTTAPRRDASQPIPLRQ